MRRSANCELYDFGLFMFAVGKSEAVSSRLSTRLLLEFSRVMGGVMLTLVVAGGDGCTFTLAPIGKASVTWSGDLCKLRRSMQICGHTASRCGEQGATTRSECASSTSALAAAHAPRQS